MQCFDHEWRYRMKTMTMKAKPRPIGGWILAVVGSLVISGCAQQRPPPVAEPPPPPEEGAPVTAQVAPPPVPPEAVVVSPGPQYVWIGGAWEWQGRWIWVPGRWVVPPRPGVIWVRGTGRVAMAVGPGCPGIGATDNAGQIGGPTSRPSLKTGTSPSPRATRTDPDAAGRRIRGCGRPACS